jgi:putative membrane-bound dehydrogenase-like protein
MKLIAHEPLVMDPVDICYDEQGHAYVVEMRDYPFPEEKDEPPTEFLGQVRRLTDSNGDGVYDQATLFADGFNWPTAAICWRGGIFLAAAPDLWYLRDSNGDGHADVRKKVLTGFGRSNVQAIVNNMRWGLDNKIHGAASGNGGALTRVSSESDQSISITRRDFRFDPETGEVEAISGGARFGNSFDDWGNRFVCNIRNPVQHVLLPQRYLARNPLLTAVSALHDAAETGDQLAVYPISAPEPWRVERAQRWMAERQNFPRSELFGAGFWTSSSGVTVYRGGIFSEPFQGNVFIGEVAGNLIHRQRLEPDGPTFRSYRADEQTEFVRSRDNWFRPVNFANAPDGTLHVLDMYREYIEHPWSIPEDIKDRMDLLSGNDRGRIYRLAPKGFAPPAPPRLGELSSQELVEHLGSPHSWWRETAQRLLFERWIDQKEPELLPPLRQLALTATSALGRLHALSLLANLGEIQEDDLLEALQDPSGPVRRRAILLTEPHLSQSAPLRDALAARADDPDSAVRMQLAFSLGELGERADVETLKSLAMRDGTSHHHRIAILSSAVLVAPQLAAELLRGPDQTPDAGVDAILRELMQIVGSQGEVGVDQFLSAWSKPAEASPSSQLAVAAGLAQGVPRSGQSLRQVLPKLSERSQDIVTSWLERAKATAGSPDESLVARLHAVQLLGEFPFAEVAELLSGTLDPQEPAELQLQSIRTIQSYSDPTAARLLTDQWRTATPAARRVILEALLARATWIPPLVEAMEQGLIHPGEIDLPQRGRLLRAGDADLQARVAALFGPGPSGSRAEVVAQYTSALQLDQADLARGKQLYQRECQACHKLGAEGGEVGPNLNSVRHRSPDDIALHILDPNRDVLPEYINYQVILRDGRTSVGIIVGETDSSLTLRLADDQETTVLRADVEQLVSTGQSIMPEGFEQKLKPDELSDVIAYLLNSPAQSEGPGDVDSDSESARRAASGE